MAQRFFFAFILFTFFCWNASYANEIKTTSKDPFSFDLGFTPTHPRSYVLAPMLSFVLPGFDQWYEGQYTAAATYTGLAIAGSIYGSQHYLAIGPNQELRTKKLKEIAEDPLTKDFSYRSYVLGSQISQTMGGLSTYHSFRTAAKTHMPYGKFRFLPKEEETVPDILMAPFNFSYLSRPNTFVPLLVGLGLAIKDHLLPESVLKTAGLKKSTFTANDMFFSSARSFNAGTHEEAMFRGWLLPVFYEAMGDDLWANIATSTLFAAAHLSTVKLPIVQGLLGFHLGNVTLENAFSIKEAVFIHVWWDVIAFVSMYSFAKATANKELLSGLSLSLPVLATTF